MTVAHQPACRKASAKASRGACQAGAGPPQLARVHEDQLRERRGRAAQGLEPRALQVHGEVGPQHQVVWAAQEGIAPARRVPGAGPELGRELHGLRPARDARDDGSVAGVQQLRRELLETVGRVEGRHAQRRRARQARELRAQDAEAQGRSVAGRMLAAVVQDQGHPEHVGHDALSPGGGGRSGGLLAEPAEGRLASLARFRRSRRVLPRSLTLLPPRAPLSFRRPPGRSAPTERLHACAATAHDYATPPGVPEAAPKKARRFAALTCELPPG